jgi:hypothetical protein
MKIPIFFGLVFGIVLANEIVTENLPDCPEGQHRVRRGDSETDSLKNKILTACIPIGEFKQNL